MDPQRERPSGISLLPKKGLNVTSFMTLRDTMNISKANIAPLAFRQMQIRRRGRAGPRRRVSKKTRQIDRGLTVPKNSHSWRIYPRKSRTKPTVETPTWSRVPKVVVKHKDRNEDEILRYVPDLPPETLEQTFAKISNGVFENLSRSGRKRRRVCRSPSITPLPQPESAFNTMTCQQTPKKARNLYTALATPIKQSSTDDSRNSLISTPNVAIDTPSKITLQPPESQRPKIYLTFRLKKSKETTQGGVSSKPDKSNKADATVKESSGPADGHLSSSRLKLPSWAHSLGRNSLGAGDGQDEDDEDPKKPVTNGCEDLDMSSDNSEKRRKRRMVKKGKRAQGKVANSGDRNSSEHRSLDPEAPEEIPEENPACRISLRRPRKRDQDSKNAVDRWLMGVPSPFSSNEIGGTTPPDSISPSTSKEGLLIFPRRASVNENIPTDPLPVKVRGRSKSNASNRETPKMESEKPRRNSMVDTFLTDGHPRIGTKFPNMAIEGYGRACGMPTTAQLRTPAGKRYTFFDENGKRVLMNPLPIPSKISERSNLTPRDASFPGPSRKQLLDDAESSRNVENEPSLDKPEVTCVIAAGESTLRGREVTAIRPSNAAREESEGRPGWRKTVLVPAHVITGENTRHEPWVASLRPLELGRSGFTMESGYGPFPESNNGSIADDSIIFEDESLFGYEIETADLSRVPESGMFPKLVDIARVADSALVQRAQQSPDTPMVEEPAMVPSTQQLADVPMVEESIVIQSAQQSPDVLMVDQPAMVPSAHQLVDVPTVEESIIIQSTQQSADVLMEDQPAMVPSAHQPADIPTVVKESTVIQTADVLMEEEPAMVPSAQQLVAVPTVEESTVIENSHRSADVLMVDQPATVPNAQQLADVPTVEEPAIIPGSQQPADGTSTTPLVNRTWSQRLAAQTALVHRINATHGFTHRRAMSLPWELTTWERTTWGRTNGQIVEMNTDNMADLGPHRQMITSRTTGHLFDGPRVAHIERTSDSILSAPRQSSLIPPTAISMEYSNSAPIRLDGCPLSGQAPAMPGGSRSNEDGQDQPGSAAPVHRSSPSSTSSNDRCGVCGCSLLEVLRCIVCGLFQTPNLPSPPVLPEAAIPLSPLNQIDLSEAANTNGIMAPSIGGTQWRQVDWNVHSIGSRTVNATPQVTPQSETRPNSSSNLQSARLEDPPSPRAHVSRDEEASGKKEGR